MAFSPTLFNLSDSPRSSSEGFRWAQKGRSEDLLLALIAGVWVYIFVVSTSLAVVSFNLLDEVVDPLVDDFLSLGSRLMVLVSMVYRSFVESFVSGAMHEHRVICVDSRIQASLF